MAILATAEGVVIITRNYDVSIASILALSAYVGFDVIRAFPAIGPLLILCAARYRSILRAAQRTPGGLRAGLLDLRDTWRSLDLPRLGDAVRETASRSSRRDVPPGVRDVVTGALPGFSNLALIAVAVVALVSVYLRYTRIGRQSTPLGRIPSQPRFMA